MSDFQVEGSVTADVASFIRSFDELSDSISKVKRDVDELSASIDELSGKDIKIKVEITGQDDITKLREDLDRLAEGDYNVKVKVEADQDSITRLREDLDRLNATGNTTVDLRVNITGADAVERLRLSIDLLTMTRHTVRINVDTGSAIAQLTALSVAIQGVQASANGASGESGGGGIGGMLSSLGGGGGMIGVIAALIPIVAALGEVFSGVAAGIVGSMATAGIGLGAFALFAVPTITKVTKVLTDLKSGAKGADDEWNALSKPMKNAVTNLEALEQEFTKLQTQMEPTVLNVFAAALNVAQAGLIQLAPVAKAAGDALAPLLQSLATNLMSGDLAKFFKYVTDNTAYFITTWGHAVGNFVLGIANMIQAFDPLSKFVSNGFLGMSQAFLKWTENLNNNKGFQNFISFVITNGPTVMSLIGTLLSTILKLTVAFAPLGIQMIQSITHWLGLIAAFVQANPQMAGLILKIVAIAGVVSTLLPIIGGLVEAIGAIDGPMLIVIAVIAAVVIAIVTWWNKCASFRDFVQDMWSKIVTWFKAGITDAKKQIDDILPMIVDLWNKYGKNIMDIVKGIWDVISSVISGAMDIIFGIIKVVLGLLTGNWKQVWNGLGTIIKGAWTIIKGAVSGLLDIIKGLLGGFVTQTKNAGKAIANGVMEGIESVWGSIKKRFEGMLQDLRNMLPFSPAKTGPFSGTGYTTYSGAALAQGLADGIDSRKSVVVNSMSVMTAMMHAALPSLQANGMSGGTSSATNTSSVGAAMAGAGSPGAVFQPGAIQINNPAQEPASDSLNRSMTRISRFGIFQGSGGSS